MPHPSVKRSQCALHKLKILTRRQVTIAKLICGQLSNKEIAHTLNLSVRTVESHKKEIMQKTGSRNIAGIVVHAIKSKIFNV